MLADSPLCSATIEHWHSRDIGHMVGAVEAAFRGVSHFAFRGSPGKRRLRQVRLALGELKMARHGHSGFSFRAMSGENLHLAFFTRGGAWVKMREVEICVRPFVSGHTLLPNRRFSLDVHPDSVVYTLDFPIAPMLHRAHALVGGQVPADAFEHEIDLQTGPGAALVRNVLSAFNEVETLATTGLSPLAGAGLSDLLANLALAATLPGLRAKLAEAPASVVPGLAERARDELAAHAHEPVRITDLATELHVSIRALQVGFKRRFGCSPLQFLIRRRLELARERLLSPELTDTVASIAMGCGMVNPVTFAQRYRQAFGELPSTTLSRSRR